TGPDSEPVSQLAIGFTGRTDWFLSQLVLGGKPDRTGPDHPPVRGRTDQMAAPPSQRPSPLLLLFCVVVAFAVLFDTVRAQNRNTTDLARALNSMFQRWRISATNRWNISGELCSGAAIDDSPIDNLNPGIKCDCSQNSTCHITALRVYALDVAGPLPDELWNLTYLTNLTFGINALSGELPRELGLLTDLRSLWASENEFTGQIPGFIGNWSRLISL
ncbi:hypothetical protein RD792_007518, partial [Penstemon davidsonii]